MSNEVTPVPLPSMGEGIQEATIVKWLKKIGERVQKNEPLVEISTDKVDTEIASPAEGYLIGISCPEGSIARIDQTIAFLGASADSKAPAPGSEQAMRAASGGSKPQAAPSPAPFAQRSPRPASSPSSSPVSPLPAPPSHQRDTRGQHQYIGWVRSSPLVRSLARDYQIPLAKVVGTGLHGRVTKNDVLAYLEQHQGASSEQTPTPASTKHRLATYWQGDQEFLDGTSVVREPMSKIRRLTAEHMVRSVQTSPHVTTTFEIDLFEVKRAREERQKAFSARHGFNLSFTPFFIHAAAVALVKHPDINASVDGEDILWRKDINIGCAVATQRGLIVPVLKGLAGLGLEDIAARLGTLVQRARDNKLVPEDVRGGTFSITNPGMFGSLHSQPIINQPQVAIMSIGAIIERPVVVNQQITVRPLCQIGLTFDHRLVDGEGGAKFLATIKQVLETPV